ncbi:transcription factor [Micractinium conductrix]|uniref:Transcription factor n=1 Tax=Micractinium conductrix TaxID=554055 RepID=A0A2P6V8I0_9CHLO|nr:transcription factor [Micractinium conductrix]|eukprot:PSC70396.1 transcription factor [Micractinium conductrix]
MLRQLGVAEAAGGLAAAAAEQRQQQQQQAPRGPPRPRERRPALPAAALAARKSKRQRGERPLAVEEAVAEAAAELIGGDAPDLAGASEKDLEHGALLDLEAYFQLMGQDVSGAVHTDGRFRGWVSPAVCERYDIPPDPAAAWEAGGGGNFSFKIDKTAIPAAQRARGWSDARAFSHTQLVKNPNAYFYRHVAPHEQQAQGEWIEEEHQAFVETARAHGVGDKWGLFASHLPQRVGYQCSAYYRDVVIPSGLVIDRRFKMTRAGKAVYVG